MTETHNLWPIVALLLSIATPTVIALIAIISAFGKYREWKGEVNSDRKSFTEFMVEIRGKFEEILARLPPPQTVAGKSPLALTDFGKVISQELSAKEWAEDIGPKLIEKVADFKEYEVYEYCVEYVTNKYSPSPDLAERIKEIAYNHGIKQEKVRAVLIIELRDQLLSKQEELRMG